MENLVISNNNLTNCVILCESYGGYFKLLMKNEDNAEMGCIVFKFNSAKRHIWLQKIETKKEFQHLGVASILMYSLENIAVESKCYRIEGTYYPTNDYALPFYLKHGYYVPNQKKRWDLYDQTWRLTKDLVYGDVKQNYKNFVEAFTINMQEKK